MLTKEQRDRLFSRLIIDQETGCLLWAGSTVAKGYGRVKVGRNTWYVHRVMYEMFAGSIPEGLQLDHLCRVRHCANVAHLEPVTSRENTIRGETLPAANLSKTHCAQGHAFEGDNLLIGVDGFRRCRACKRDISRAIRARRAPGRAAQAAGTEGDRG